MHGWGNLADYLRDQLLDVESFQVLALVDLQAHDVYLLLHLLLLLEYRIKVEVNLPLEIPQLSVHHFYIFV